MATAKKEVVEYKHTAGDKRQIAIVDAATKCIAEMKENLTWTDEKLDEMLAHVDEQEVVKGALKTCTQTRTAIDAAHKLAKAPYLTMGKEVDAMKNEAIKQVKEIETPLEAAVLRRKKKDEEAAKKAQAAKEDETQKELVRMRALLAKHGIEDEEGESTSEFEEAATTLSITTAAQFKTLKTLITPKAVKALQFDANGQAYNLEITVKRSEFDTEG